MDQYCLTLSLHKVHTKCLLLFAGFHQPNVWNIATSREHAGNPTITSLSIFMLVFSAIILAVVLTLKRTSFACCPSKRVLRWLIKEANPPFSYTCEINHAILWCYNSKVVKGTHSYLIRPHTTLSCTLLGTHYPNKQWEPFVCNVLRRPEWQNVLPVD